MIALRVDGPVVHASKWLTPACFVCRLSLGTLLQGTQYLDALGSMPMSLHTVEAVSSLAAGGKLPRTFLGPFISRCVAACQSSQACAARHV